jgi:hypothetical protein
LPKQLTDEETQVVREALTGRPGRLDLAHALEKAAKSKGSEALQMLSLAFVLGWLLLAAVVLFAPGEYLTILFFGGGAMFAAIRQVRNRMIREGRYRWRPAAFLAGYFSFILIITVMTAIVRPDPLPRIDLLLRGGAHIQGELVVIASNNWYVAKPNGELLSVPTINVDRSTLSYQDPETDGSLFDSIWDQFS